MKNPKHSNYLALRLALPPSKDNFQEEISDTFISPIKASITQDKTQLNILLTRLGKNTANTYLELLKNLAETNSDIEIEWGSQNLEKGDKIAITRENMITTIDHIKSLRSTSPT